MSKARDAGGAAFDDPNRESVGLDPIYTETGDNVPDPPPPEGEGQPAARKGKSSTKAAPEQLELELEEPAES